MPHLVQLLLPVRDASGRPFARGAYDALAHELTGRFGGVTAYTRAPATGLWEEPSGDKVRDDVIVYEVMTDRIEEGWWAALRERLEREFRQDEIVVRAQEIRRL
jgi:hypothetical protein